MSRVQKKPDGGLRNTLYEQQTRSGRRLTRTGCCSIACWCRWRCADRALVWRWCRGIRVVGIEHITAALERAPSFIPVYWHQHQLFCVKPLLEMRAAGVKLGFLISPSVDGEIGAMLVRRLGAEAIRGSSTRTPGRGRCAIITRRSPTTASRRRSRPTARAGRRGSSSRARSCSRSCRSGRSFRWRSPHHAPGRSNGTNSCIPKPLRAHRDRRSASLSTCRRASMPPALTRLQLDMEESAPGAVPRGARPSLREIAPASPSNTSAYLVILIICARILRVCASNQALRNCVTHSHFGSNRVANC